MSDQAEQTMAVVVGVPAEIGVHKSELVHQRIVAALTPGVDVVIADMTSTTFCDSSGVHAVVFAHEAAVARGIELRLAGRPGGSVRRGRQVIGAGSVMPVYSSLAEAMDGI